MSASVSVYLLGSIIPICASVCLSGMLTADPLLPQLLDKTCNSGLCNPAPCNSAPCDSAPYDSAPCDSAPCDSAPCSHHTQLQTNAVTGLKEEPFVGAVSCCMHSSAAVTLAHVASPTPYWYKSLLSSLLRPVTPVLWLITTSRMHCDSHCVLLMLCVHLQAEIIPTCRELGIGIVAYSPLGRGFLTGTVRSVKDLHETDWRVVRMPRFQGENLEKVRSCSVNALSWMAVTVSERFKQENLEQVRCCSSNTLSSMAETASERLKQDVVLWCISSLH